ncbi:MULTISPECIES: PepSY domain-containing protein [unclassified Thiobacillus]|uniref:PepSY domain-containing protein n=1 Tax=unclassified Thiobacillus TaxID=2646513 RepID=UPI00086E9FC6|nr:MULTISPECIES: PepSY domain-containing protein [unclassified Thiobacillus]MBN8780188.1 PepSY domain-containing protein [Thiobacillus sp.]ODV02799.1 MAG: hypothetical protein ABT23_04790 [Thiobacillus sp. SCN 63-57]
MTSLRFTLAALALVPVLAHAAADCEAHPKEQWMKEEDLKAALKDAGYTIKKFKVDGNCYEMYGHNEKGQRVEIYMDTVTGRPVKAYLD